MNENFSIIAHGWIEGIITPWISLTVQNLLQYRGGCVFVMDYSKYANVSNYFSLVQHYEGILAVLTKKVKQIENYDRQYCFGFSFGSRLCIGAGLNIGNQTFGRMDLCDPAGKLFFCVTINSFLSYFSLKVPALILMLILNLQLKMSLA